MTKKDANLIWIDLEMTGLIPEKDVIIEIATVITNANLEVLAEGPVLAIHHGAEILLAMDAWNSKHHAQSGLIERIKNSDISTKQAEIQTLDFLKKHVNKGVSPMCGNSICQDRRFLFNYMPELESFFHYRHIDVSTLKELVKRWQPSAKMQFEKNSAHLALSDIYDSIAELKHYRQHFINGT